MRILVPFATILAVACNVHASQAHEFWIDPVDYTVAPGDPVIADLRVGEAFSGSAYSYIPQRIRLFETAQGADRTPVEMRMGDRPALSMSAPETPGLLAVLHVTTDNRLTYSDWDTFVRFVTHKDAAWTLDAHAARGLSEDGVVEIYSRYAKALVAVGTGAGQDRAYGLTTEIVALANPYADDVSAGLPVQVLYRDAPRPGAQVEVFDKAPGGAVAVTTLAADSDGIAVVPVAPGHRYLIDAVVLREPDPARAEETGAVWESLWASLTLEVPAD
ncbi:DUF4198 domain-containing protein [Rhodobacteraceae bacterium CCMM004]|nr:DUF4198 domain-containing protein [Rhodobacteraceae bacterium CCMM004]